MKKKQIFVTPLNGNWTVSNLSINFETRAEAVNAGARIGRANGNAELIVRKLDGKIGERRTYGLDPFPPKDK